MPKYKKNYRKRRYSSRLRDKKLNTLVEKRMNEISKKNIQANEKFYQYSVAHTADGYDWDEVTALPATAFFRSIDSGAMESKLISNVGGLVRDQNPVELSELNQKQLTIGLKGIQLRFAFQNPNAFNVRVQVSLIFIPNFNNNTDDSIDYLRPDVFMLWKKGSGNLLYDGWDKNELKNIATNIDTHQTTYTILKSETFNLRSTTGLGGRTERKWITKTWKNLKKHNLGPRAISTLASDLTDGNYFFTVHHDAPSGQSIKYIGCSTFKFKMYAPTLNIGG